MPQVNFRLSKDENEIIEYLSAEAGISVAEYSKRIVKERLLDKRLDLAFKLLAEGKIHKKHAWELTGLSYAEFMIEWTKRGAEDIIIGHAEQKGLDLALALEVSKFWKKPSKKNATNA
jgi:predicted HTH domain antitoxin